MAIYHYNMQMIKRSEGRNAVACAAYRSGETLVDESTGFTKDYPRDVQPIAFILAPENAPKWVYDRQKLWSEVEKVEKRKDSQLAREINIALPVELSNEQQEKLVREFVSDNFVSNGMIADVAIHRDDINNPHFHVMLTTRHIDENGFGKKAREWNPSFKNVQNGRGFVAETNTIIHAREMWAKYANQSLADAGIEQRITHLKLEDGTLKLIPTKHLGPTANAMEKRGIKTDVGDLNREIKKHNAEVLSFHERKKELEKEKEQQREFDSLTPDEKVAIKNAAKEMKKYVDYDICNERLEQLNNWETSVERKLSLNPNDINLNKQLKTIHEQREVVKNAMKAFENEANRYLIAKFDASLVNEFTPDEQRYIYDYIQKYGEVEESNLKHIVARYDDEQSLKSVSKFMKQDVTYDSLKTEIDKLHLWKNSIDRKQAELITAYENSSNKEMFEKDHSQEFKDVFAQEESYEKKKIIIEKAFEVLERQMIMKFALVYPEYPYISDMKPEAAKHILDLNAYYGKTIPLNEISNIQNQPRFTFDERKEIHESIQELKEVQKMIRSFSKEDSPEAQENLPLLQSYSTQQKEAFLAKYDIDITDPVFIRLFMEECKHQRDPFIEMDGLTYLDNNTNNPLMSNNILGDIITALEQAERDADQRTQERQRMGKGRGKRRNIGLDL